MRIQRGLLALVGAMAMSMALVVTVLATSITSGGITLTYPTYPLSGPALMSCEPSQVASANTISLAGVPAGSSVLVQFAWANPYGGTPNYQAPLNFDNVTSDPLVVSVPYPASSDDWPYVNATTNERAIAVSVFVMVTRPDKTTVKLASKNWWVRCLPPPAPSKGCTPGYWKQDQHFDSWPAGRNPADDFNAAFGVTASFNPHTLLDALWLGGGGENALARHAVAALLNAETFGSSYAYSEAWIISSVQNAYATGDFEPLKNLLDAANNAGCPLN